MIFNNDLIFIHIGKTGGISCAEYLLHNLKRPVYNCNENAVAEVKDLSITGVVPKLNVPRYSTLAEALEYIQSINGKQLADFSKVVAVIRHPYTLEYSFYKHLQKPGVREQMKKFAWYTDLIYGDFENFVRNAGYHRKDHTQDSFVRLGDEIPICVELVRFEKLAVDFPAAVSDFCNKRTINRFEHRNKNEYESSIFRELTDDVKELIYQKHKFMFDSGLYSTTI